MLIMSDQQQRRESRSQSKMTIYQAQDRLNVALDEIPATSPATMLEQAKHNLQQAEVAAVKGNRLVGSSCNLLYRHSFYQNPAITDRLLIISIVHTGQRADLDRTLEDFAVRYIELQLYIERGIPLSIKPMPASVTWCML